LQPLSSVHYDTRFTNPAGREISYNGLATLGAIGVLLLLTACINFINLNTVFVIDRAKEAGIRKVVGSSRAQLVLQFLTETFVITVIALVLSCCLVEIVLINLTPILGYQLSFSPLSNLPTIGMLLALPVMVTLLAGLYPGLALSRFQPITALKTRINEQSGGFSLRRLLIVFQLVITQVLIVATIIIVQQLRHFEHQSLGIDSEAVVEFELPDNSKEVIHKLRERLALVPGVANVAMSNTGSTSPNQWTGDAAAEVDGQTVKVAAGVKFADNGYVETYRITLEHGENLLDSDTANRFLVNESFTREIGFQQPEEAIGTPVEIWGHQALISGVVKDFNTSSLHEAIPPAIILNGTDAFYLGAIRINTTHMNETLATVRDIWEDLYPQYVFDYAFLDDTIAKFYEAEHRTSYLIGLFAVVAIVIGCIGLMGLISFIAKRKTKEVGIRKSLGASVVQIVKLFSGEFAFLVAVSFVVAAPLAHYATEEWLANFVYRITPGLTTYMSGLAITFMIVAVTVGYRAYRAAMASPVNALRTE
jgi:ABC-type lipoprotein release transport system permease subunit